MLCRAISLARWRFLSRELYESYGVAFSDLERPLILGQLCCTSPDVQTLCAPFPFASPSSCTSASDIVLSRLPQAREVFLDV